MMPNASRAARTLRFTAATALALIGGVAQGQSRRPAPRTAVEATTEPAEVILTNARVYTVDSTRPRAEAVAIRGGRILAVGSAEEVARRKGPATRVVDLGGRMLMPAFGDAHNHPIFGGLSFTGCALQGGTTLDDYRAIIAKCVADTPGNSIIFGRGWEDALFPPNGVPRKEVLDAISTTHAMLFVSVGGHSYWLNSKALELAGITKATPDPANGKIDRDPQTGEPVGGLQEAARSLADRIIPPVAAADRQKAIAYTVTLFNSLGITSWHDAGVEWNDDGTSNVLDAYKAVQDRGQLTTHVVIDLKWKNEAGAEQIPGLLRASAHAKALGLTANSAKFYLDGVIPQQTAAMIAPYTGTSVRGESQIPPATLKRAVTELDARGIQAHVHAIGDGAAREALDAFAAARRANGRTDTRPMISHLNVVDPADQPRFRQLGATAIFQPLWACNEPYMRLTKGRIGPVRSTYIYPQNSIRKSGGRLAFGADWSVASANPLEGIQVALTRLCPAAGGTEPLGAGERLTLEQAIHAYTMDVAYVNHLERETGSITPGKSADLIVLDRDLFTTPVTEIGRVKVLTTLFRGKEVYGTLSPAP